MCTNTYLATKGYVGQLLLKDDEKQSKGGHEKSVTSITKHDSKEEGEGDDGVGSCMGTRSASIHNYVAVTGRKRTLA